MNKKGIFQVVIFLVALILCDSIFGMFAKMLFNSQRSGKYARLTYIVKADTSAIVILGSSHAMAHFIPEIIQDSFHESTFNYGTNGQKLLFSRTGCRIFFHIMGMPGILFSGILAGKTDSSGI